MSIEVRKSNGVQPAEQSLRDGTVPEQETSDFERFIIEFGNFFATIHDGDQKTKDIYLQGLRVVLGDYRANSYHCTIDVWENDSLVFTSFAPTPTALLANLKKNMMSKMSSSLPKSS